MFDLDGLGDAMSFADAVEELLPEGWEIYDSEMSPDFLLLCPHGNILEQDRRGPCGCISPMRKLGLV